MKAQCLSSDKTVILIIFQGLFNIRLLTLQYHHFLAADCFSGLHQLKSFYYRFLTLWLGLVPTAWLVVFSLFSQCKPLHPLVTVDLLDSPASAYDVSHIFGSNISVAENSIDLKLLENCQHIDSLQQTQLKIRVYLLFFQTQYQMEH